ncbi:Bug family tripartite tricarboxylate transporter substrate binding protein [Bradyrhizobium sp. SZCCHNS3004]|uniref:Bug family tripartite tricarboxylate transporter substrate binding protein n=1 Tax=Bradyrhizobium sp. SZCCHNS3004 TaxID=3057312 RepID=UPI002915F353|nr:tripartite tricarboxylate transporter substrate-binding protein [Bradyrhizobium sp. SZCCHNS3004]
MRDGTLTETTKDVTFTRRAWLRSAAWATMAASPVAAALPAWAQPYPTRPVTWVIPFAPGGATDQLSTPISKLLTARLGQPFTLEHRPGAGGNVATRSVVEAAPDGYTILATSTANLIGTSFDPSLPFDVTKDLAAVAGMARMPLLLLVNNDLPVRNLAEFVAYAKGNPGKLSVSTAGPGTVQHLSAELFRSKAGIKWTIVHYRGSSPALVDVASGHVHAAFDNAASALETVKAGKLRAIAVTTRTRSERLPDLPPIADVLPGFATSGFYGVAVPRDTPRPIVELLNREINAAQADPAIRQHYAELGAIPLAGTVSEYNAVVAAESVRWRNVVALLDVRKTD